MAALGTAAETSKGELMDESTDHPADENAGPAGPDDPQPDRGESDGKDLEDPTQVGATAPADGEQPTTELGADSSVPGPEAGDGVPIKVCPKCSTQSRTAGGFCPHCGASYVRKRGISGARGRVSGLSKRTKIVVGVLLALLLLGGAGAGVAAKLNHDDQVTADRKAAQERRDQAARDAERQAAAAEAASRQKDAADKFTRDARREAIKEMEKSVTADAKSKVNEGLLDGPIKRTSCEPIGGGSTDDLKAKTGRFECIAVNKENADGTSEGYRFGATMNWDDFSFRWHLGA